MVFLGRNGVKVVSGGGISRPELQMNLCLLEERKEGGGAKQGDKAEQYLFSKSRGVLPFKGNLKL